VTTAQNTLAAAASQHSAADGCARCSVLQLAKKHVFLEFGEWVCFGFRFRRSNDMHASAFQELLFCETCDSVFCTLCTGGTHKPSVDSPAGSPAHGSANSSSVSLDHTVIPFSIAIKRMSEILIYKANECRAKVRSPQQRTTCSTANDSGLLPEDKKAAACRPTHQQISQSQSFIGLYSAVE
jgi:hypothetical protein